MKTCAKCKLPKPLTDFHVLRRSKDGRYYYCKACVLPMARTYKAQHPDRIVATNLKHVSGITAERYAELLAAQGGGCAICRTDEPGGNGRFHVDHDHKCCPGSRSCGKCVRGLLCARCNVLLGMAADNTDTLAAAIGYLSAIPVAA